MSSPRTESSSSSSVSQSPFDFLDGAEAPAKRIKLGTTAVVLAGSGTTPGLAAFAFAPISASPLPASSPVPAGSPVGLSSLSSGASSSGFASPAPLLGKRKRGDTPAALQIPAADRKTTVSPAGFMMPRALTSTPPKAVKPRPIATRPAEIKVEAKIDEEGEVKKESKQDFLFFAESPKQKVTLPDEAEMYFKRLSEIAGSIKSLELKSSENIYTYCYGLVLIGELARKIEQRIHPELIRKKGQMHGIGVSKLSPDFKTIIENLYKVRNIVADHFVRIKDHAILNLGADIGKLNVFEKNECVVGASFINVTTIANLLEKFNNLNSSKMDLVSYMMSLLKEIVQIKKAAISTDAVAMFPLCMRYVVVGTCARELIKVLPDNIETKDLIVKLKELKETRNEFAHANAAYKNTQKFREEIAALKDQENYAFLEKQLPLFVKIFEKAYTEKSLAVGVATLDMDMGSAGAGSGASSSFDRNLISPFRA